MIELSVYHPGWPEPVVILEFEGRNYQTGQPTTRFDVWRPAYSHRGRYVNTIRREAPTLAEAYTLARRPLPSAVREWIARHRPAQERGPA